LPLKYLAYFPAAIFLGLVPETELWIQLGIEIVWVFVFILASRVMLARGLRRYSGFGG
jgi:ABC-2 type transport system permease protein